MQRFNKHHLTEMFKAEKSKTAFSLFDAVFGHLERVLESKGKGVVVSKMPGSWRTNFIVNENYKGLITLYDNGISINYCSSRKPTDIDDHFTEQSVINYHDLGKLVPIEGMVIKSCTLYEIMDTRELQVILVFADE